MARNVSSSELKFFEQVDPRDISRAWDSLDKTIRKKFQGHIGVVFLDTQLNPIHDDSWEWLVDVRMQTAHGQPQLVAIVA